MSVRLPTRSGSDRLSTEHGWSSTPPTAPWTLDPHAVGLALEWTRRPAPAVLFHHVGLEPREAAATERVVRALAALDRSAAGGGGALTRRSDVDRRISSLSDEPRRHALAWLGWLSGEHGGRIGAWDEPVRAAAQSVADRLRPEDGWKDAFLGVGVGPRAWRAPPSVRSGAPLVVAADGTPLIAPEARTDVAAWALGVWAGARSRWRTASTDERMWAVDGSAVATGWNAARFVALRMEPLLIGGLADGMDLVTDPTDVDTLGRLARRWRAGSDAPVDPSTDITTPVVCAFSGARERAAERLILMAERRALEVAVADAGGAAGRAGGGRRM